MFATAVRRVVSRLQPGGAPTDAELVLALAPPGADREAAFAELVGRYGPMVLGVCGRVLGDIHAAEDAFQAVFLVLARKAELVRPPGTVGGWLYGVAVRTARKAKTTAARRRRHEMTATTLANPHREGAPAPDALDRADLRAVIDAELAALPETHRAAVVLCDLQGKTRAEAALELGRAEGTVASWLARGRKTLAARLAKRGVSLPAAGLLAVAAPAVVSAELSAVTVGVFAGRGASPSALALAESVMKGLSVTSARLVAGVCAVGALLALVATAAAWHPRPEPLPEPPVRSLRGVVAPATRSDSGGFFDHNGFVHSVSYAPDGKALVSVGAGGAAVWDVASRKKLFGVEGAEVARFSDDGTALLYLTKDEFHVADPATGKSREKHPRGAPKAVSGFGLRGATIAGDGSARVEFDGVRHHITNYPVKGEAPALADQKENAPLDRTRTAGDYGRAGAFAPGGVTRFAGTHAATTRDTGKGVLTIWELPEGRRTGTVVSKFGIQTFVWSPDGKEIAVVSAQGVRTHLTAAKQLAGIDGPNDNGPFKRTRDFDAPGGTAVAWSEDGALLAVAVQEGAATSTDSGEGGAGTTSTMEVARTTAVLLFDTATGKQLRRFEGFPENLPVVSLAFRPGGKELLCGSGFVPGDGPAEGAPKPARDAKGLRVLNLDEGTKPKLAWKPHAEIELTGWAGGSVAYSLDGKTLFVGGSGGTVHAYESATRKKLWEHQSDGPFGAVAVGGSLMFTTANLEVLAVTGKGGVRLLDPATGKIVERIEDKDSDEKTRYPVAVGWFPDRPAPNMATGERVSTSRKVIFGTAFGYTVKSWSEGPKVRLADTLGTITQGTAGSNKLPDLNAVPLAVAGGGRGAVLTGPIDRKTGKNVLWVWSAGSGAANELLEGHKAPVVSAAWARDDAALATGDADGQVLVWDAQTFKVTARPDLGGRVAALAISPDGKHIAAAVVSVPREQTGKSYHEDVFVWPTADRRPNPELVSRQVQSGVFKGLASVAFSPDGKKLVAAFANLEPPVEPAKRNGRVRFFARAEPVPDNSRDPADRNSAAPKQDWAEVATLSDLKGSVNGVALSPDGKLLAATDSQGVIAVWDAKTRKLLTTTRRTTKDAYGVAFSPDNKHLAIGSDRGVQGYELPGMKRAAWGEDSTEFWRAGEVLFSPDGTRIATSDGYLTRVHSLAGKELWSFLSHPRPKGKWVPRRAAPAWSPDGKWLAVPSKDQDSGAWGVSLSPKGEGAPTRVLTGPKAPVTCVAWAPDGSFFVAGDEDGTVIAWDAKTDKEIWRRTFHGRDMPAGWVYALAVSPADGTVAAAVNRLSGKCPQCVMLLAPRDGEEVAAALWKLLVPVTSVVWARDGQTLLGGCPASPHGVFPGDDGMTGAVVVWTRKP